MTTITRVKGDIHTYICKFTKIVSDKEDYVLSFGGLHNSCVVLSASCQIGANVESVYLDRVEYNSKCTNDEDLIRGIGTKDMLQTALWHTYTIFPHLKSITLMDDSHIECIFGKRQYKLPLAHDYILKKNKTWYEFFFRAELPESLVSSYLTSLTVLDNPCIPYEILVEKGAHFLEEYKDIYQAAESPRNFMKKLRDVLGSDYCMKVSPWLAKYFMLLHIDVYKMSWFIHPDNLAKPTQYKEIPSKSGGVRRSTRKKGFVKYRIAPHVEEVYISGSVEE